MKHKIAMKKLLFVMVISRGSSCWGVIIRGQYNSPSWEFLGVIVSGDNCLGVFVLGWNCPGGSFPGANCLGRICPKGNCPKTKKMLKVRSSSRL